MDIHKPKPFHNGREFLKEYGIIVLGVLTALGLEQAIESWHERQQFAETREAIDAELRQGLASAHVMADLSKCQIRQLVLLSDAVGKGDLARAEAMDKSSDITVGLPTSYQTWTAAVSSDVSKRFKPYQQSYYSGAFFILDHETAWTADFYRSHGRLRGLMETGLSRSPTASAAAVSELAEAISILGNKQGAFIAYTNLVEQRIGLKVTQADIDAAQSQVVGRTDMVAKCEAAAKAMEALAG